MQEQPVNMDKTLLLLEKLKSEMPEVWTQAQVVGKWVWLEFNVPPLKEVRESLKSLGFHWNGGRKCWQHPCGATQTRDERDPRDLYPVVPATTLKVQETIAQPPNLISREFKIVTLRECPLPEGLQMCDTPDKAAQYWRTSISTNPYFNPDCECFAVLFLNTRRRVKGHQIVSIGTLDTLLVHPRDVFRVAIIAASAAVVIMHNHPSGESSPSEADIKVTRDLMRAGQLLKIEVLDHVIMGQPNHSSLRAMGYFSN